MKLKVRGEGGRDWLACEARKGESEQGDESQRRELGLLNPLQPSTRHKESPLTDPRERRDDLLHHHRTLGKEDLARDTPHAETPVGFVGDTRVGSWFGRARARLGLVGLLLRGEGVLGSGGRVGCGGVGV